MIVTLFGCVVRIGITVAISLIKILRIDCAVMPPGFEQMDMGFNGFIALLFLYEKHKAPIPTEMIDYLCNPAPIRGVDHFRRDLENGKIPDTPENS